MPEPPLIVPFPANSPSKRLKNVRQSLQEVVEDDATGKGSASRLALILGAVTLSVALLGTLALQVYGPKDLTPIIQSLILALAGGGAGPYTCKRVMEAFRAQASSPPPAPDGGSDVTA